MMKKYLILIMAAFLCFTAAATAEDILLELPGGTVQLVKPISVEKADYYLDGGTIGVELKDAAGKQFQFCLDGRMRAVPWWAALLHLPPEPYSMYVNAMHPSVQNSVIIPVGGLLEKKILTILEEWYGAIPEPDSLPPGAKVVSQLINKLKERGSH